MTRKHFEALAAGLREARPEVTFGERYSVWHEAVTAVAKACAASNAAFDRMRFLEACGSLTLDSRPRL
jgi:hypothetical protein